MAQTAVHLVDHVIPRVPVRQWVLSLPIPLRVLLAAQPKLVTPVLQVVHRVIARFLLKQAGVKADEADSGAVTLIQRFGSAGSSRTWVCRRVHRLGSLLVARPCRRPDDSDSSPFGWPTEQGDGDRLRARVFGTDGCGAAPGANP